MRTGGISGKNLRSYLITTIEILNAFKENNVNSNIFKILIRIPIKLKQLIFINYYKFNKKFKLFKFLFDKNFYDQRKFNIISKIKSIPFKKILYYRE